jgi:hypothetical protein
MPMLPATLPAFDRRLVAGAAALLGAVAIAGYLVGHRPPPSPSREQTLTASVAAALLDFPASWQPSTSVPTIKGLQIEHPLLLVPAGSGGHAGLLAGALPAREHSPLPSQFLAAAGRRPQTSVVNLQEAQAYRYTGLTVPGSGQALVLFVIPNPGASPTALACYAAPAALRYMQACEHVVARLTLVGQSQTYELAPQPTYAGQLSSAILSLDQARTKLRRGMGSRVPPATVVRLAGRLAQAFARAAASLSAVEPSIPTAGAQAVLSGTILRAHAAYSALAGAAHRRDQVAFTTARTRVLEAETAVEEALAGFGLLGYQPA